MNDFVLHTHLLIPKGLWECLVRHKTGHIILDKNFGTHEATVADFDGDGKLDIAGKGWRANEINGNQGRNHIDYLKHERSTL